MTPNDLMIFGKTIWGEARGESIEGQIAVAHVIVNRARKGGWWGDTVPGVCLKPKQFSCWNEGDPNRSKMGDLSLDNRALARAVSIAAGVLSGDLPDKTGGATHYHTTAIEPSWSAGHEPSARIGNHVFFNSIK